MYTNKLKNDQSWRIVNDCFHKKNQNNKYKIVQLDLRYLTLAIDCTATKYWPHKDYFDASLM